jgi:CRP/FNR family transcriptional regulator, cyclic AMP receptor protein
MLNPFQKSYSTKEINLFRFLTKIKIFEKLSYKEMSYFLPYLYLRDYNNNEAVFLRGDPSNALYLVKNGKVSLSVDLRGDKFEMLRMVRSGEAFGTNTLIANSHRVCNAIVDSESADLYVIPKVNIFEIFQDNETVRAKMISSLAEIYNQITVNLFKSYKSSAGFFNLAQIFAEISENDHPLTL